MDVPSRWRQKTSGGFGLINSFQFVAISTRCPRAVRGRTNQDKLTKFEDYNGNVFYSHSRLGNEAHSKATATIFTIIFAKVFSPNNASFRQIFTGSLVNLRTGNPHICQPINAQHFGQTFQYKSACSSWSTGRSMFAPFDSRKSDDCWVLFTHCILHWLSHVYACAAREAKKLFLAVGPLAALNMSHTHTRNL